jgi:hypothetical protein
MYDVVSIPRATRDDLMGDYGRALREISEVIRTLESAADIPRVPGFRLKTINLIGQARELYSEVNAVMVAIGYTATS